MQQKLLVHYPRGQGGPTITHHPSSFWRCEGAWNLRDKIVAVGTTLGSLLAVCYGSIFHLK